MAVSEQTLATGKQLDALCINTIRTLAMDAVQQANSGHPGTPMANAPLAYLLYTETLRHGVEDGGVRTLVEDDRVQAHRARQEEQAEA